MKMHSEGFLSFLYDEVLQVTCQMSPQVPWGQVSLATSMEIVS